MKQPVTITLNPLDRKTADDIILNYADKKGYKISYKVYPIQDNEIYVKYFSFAFRLLTIYLVYFFFFYKNKFFLFFLFLNL